MICNNDQALRTANLACESLASDAPDPDTRRDLELTRLALARLSRRLSAYGLAGVPLAAQNGAGQRRRG